MARGRRGTGGRLRGIPRHEGAGLLESIQERFEQLAHGHKGIVIKQRSHPLPQQELAPQLGPHRLKQGATQLLGLIHQERQHHQHAKDHREMLLAMPVVVLKMIALVFQRIEGLVFDLPPGASSPHEPIHVALAHAYDSHPTEVLELVLAYLPGLDEMDLPVRIRLIERHVIDQAKAMDNPGGAVMSFIIGDAPSLLRCLHLLEQIGLVAFFDPQNGVKIVVLQDLKMRSIGTQAVFADDDLEVGVILTQFGNEPFGGRALTIICVCSILLPDRFRHHGDHFPPIRMDNRRAQQLLRICHATVPVGLLQTRRAVNRLRGKITRPLERQQVVAITVRHRFQRLAALELPKDTLEQWA